MKGVKAWAGRWIAMPVVLGFLACEGAVARELPEFTQLAEKNGPTVVNISTTQKKSAGRSLPHGFDVPEFPEGSPWGDLFKRFFGDPPEGGHGAPEQFDSRSLGSGFIIDGEGHILTNNHVVENADEILVKLNDRRELRAELVGADKRSDIALLKVEAKDLPVTKLGRSSEIKVGEWVMAIGSPFGFDHSVSVGVVSAVGRSLPSESYVPFIQTDVAINPGNSGGPLFNLDGEVIGINSQIFSRTGGYMGLSFAIPIDVAMEVVSQIKDRGYVTRGWLGVLIQDVTRELAESFGMKKPMGALVAKVLENSPASKAGIEVGDVILEFNGRDIVYSSDLPPMVGRTAIGTDARVKLLREGKTRMVKVPIAELPTEEELAQAPQRPSRASDNRLGIAVTELSAEQRKQLEVDRGLVVTEVSPGPAAEAGIRRGDVIVKLNNVNVESASQFRDVVDKLPKGRSVPVLVQRRSGPIFLALRTPEE